MKIGRNDPCRCGSGKKYKTCCLRKDHQAAYEKNEAERLQLATSMEKHSFAEPIKPEVSRPLPPPVRPPDPHMEALDARWKQFEGEDFDGRIDLFQKSLDEPELIDEESAFSMLNEIFDSSIQHGARERFDELVRMLRERLPDVYAPSRQYYLQWQLSNAIASGRDETVCSLAREIAEIAGEDADVFHQCLDQLAYHGKLKALTDAMQIAWPLIKDSSNVLRPEEFARMGLDYVVFECLERDPKLDGRDPTLIERARFFYDDLNINPFANYVTHLAGRADRQWMMSDFAFGSRRRQRSRPEPAAKKTPEDNLCDLASEFSGYIRREEGVPYTKAALARENIIRYILERHGGELVPHESTFDRVRTPKRNQMPDHILCPDRTTLDRYFGKELGFLSPERYPVAATFELIPAWLRFLELRGLITVDQHQNTHRSTRFAS